MPIDEGILPLVVGLWAHGISTTSSCEGHLDHGEPYPWVNIDKFPPGQWGDPDQWWKSERKRKWLCTKNKPSILRLSGLLAAYYARRHVPYADQLSLSNVNTFVCSAFLEPIGARVDSVVGLRPADQNVRLQAYQREVRRFATFLRRQFLSRRRSAR